MSYYRHGPHRPSGIGIDVPGVTPLVKKIIIANVVIWLIHVVVYKAVGGGIDPMTAWFGVVPHNVVRGWLWQPFTYMFLHNPQGVMHILFNMLMLWMFGGELERLWGPRAFLRYYLICGVGGGIAATGLGLATGNEWNATIGASGAMFGLFAAYGMVFANRTILFMFFIPMKARTMALLLIGINFFYLVSQPGSPVAHIAHLGGAVTGYLYLKRAWRIGEFYRELRWKIRRRRFKTVQRDDDTWLN